MFLDVNGSRAIDLVGGNSYVISCRSPSDGFQQSQVGGVYNYTQTTMMLLRHTIFIIRVTILHITQTFTVVYKQSSLTIIIGVSEASPFLVMNVEILSVSRSVCLSWTGTIFVFCTRDPLPTFT